MNEDEHARANLLETIVYSLERELSARSIAFHATVAERFGLNPTDHKALDALYQTGAIPAGHLAELTGLTSGAVTGIVDRLERAGFVTRERSPYDRRQVIIQPNDARRGELGHLFQSLGQAMSKHMSKYSDDELRVIFDYLSLTIGVLKEETLKLRES